MKYGIRKPSVKKSISARTTGKLKRTVKKTVNPLYGKKGIGLVNDPKKAVYNKIYNKTTVGVGDIARSVSGGSAATHSPVHTSPITAEKPLNLGDPNVSDKRYKTNSVLFYILGLVFVFLGLVTLPIGIIFLILSVFCFMLGRTASGIVKNRRK